MTYDPNSVPPGGPREPIHTETVIVRPSSNAGWWIVFGLAGAVLIAVLWILASGGREDDTETLLAEAQADAASARNEASQAVLQSQISGAQQSVDIARMDTARARADAMTAASEARAEIARADARPPVIITVPEAPPTPSPSGPSGGPTIAPTSPQP